MKLKNFLPSKFWVSVFLTVFICVALSWKLFLSRDVVLSFNQQSDHDVTYRVFHATKPEALFEDQDSVTQTFPATKHNISITLSLPQKALWRFRVMIESTDSKNITLSNFKLSGKTVLELTDLKKFNFYNFPNKKINSDSVELWIKSNSQNKPYIDYTDVFHVNSKTNIDWKTFITLWIIYTIIVYKFIAFLAEYKNKRGYSRIDIVLLAVFFFCIWLPMLNISDAEKSIQENRMFAKKPAFSFKNPSGYGEKFNAWYSDHFFGRVELLSIYHGIEDIFSHTGNDRILKGDNNWFFFKGDNSISNFQNITRFSDAELQSIATYLSAINDWAKRNGKDFYYVIAPDKNKVYGENITIIKKTNPDSESRANQLKNYLEKNTKVKVIYLYDTLHANKDKGLLYWKHDTHWSELGAYYGYLEMMRIIKQHHPNVPTIQAIGWNNARHELGDLLFGNTIDDSTYIVPQMPRDYDCDMINSHDIKCTNKTKKVRLAMFRDSFTMNLLPYLNSSFAKARYWWRYNITPDDLKYMMDNADIIILEAAERAIPKLVPLSFPEE